MCRDIAYCIICISLSSIFSYIYFGIKHKQLHKIYYHLAGLGEVTINFVHLFAFYSYSDSKAEWPKSNGSFCKQFTPRMMRICSYGEKVFSLLPIRQKFMYGAN